MSEHTMDPSALGALHRAIPGGLGTTWSTAGVRDNLGSALYGSAFYATAAIPGTDIEKGSLVVHAHRSTMTREHLTAIKGKMTRIPRSHFSLISEHIDSLRLIESSWDDTPKLGRYLRHRCALSGNDATSRILLVKPIGSAVSEPIEADSDAAALFELIASVGSRIPEEMAP